MCRFVHQHSAEVRNSLHGLAYLFSGCVSKRKNLNIEFKEVSGSYQKKFFPIFESVDKKSCYLLEKKDSDQKNLSKNIEKLMGENRQGFIYIECFPEGVSSYINAQPYKSEWLVIYRDQDSDYFNSKINLIDDLSPIELEAVKSDDINPEDT